MMEFVSAAAPVRKIAFVSAAAQNRPVPLP
jgi:hypothetical protein